MKTLKFVFEISWPFSKKPSTNFNIMILETLKVNWIWSFKLACCQIVLSSAMSRRWNSYQDHAIMDKLWQTCFPLLCFVCSKKTLPKSDCLCHIPKFQLRLYDGAVCQNSTQKRFFSQEANIIFSKFIHCLNQKRSEFIFNRLD